MFKSAGLEDKPIIDYTDFQQLMKEFNLDYLTVGLDFKASNYEIETDRLLILSQGARQNFLDTSTNTAKVKPFSIDAITEQKGI